MPIYEYRCGGGHQFEVVQRMTDGPVASCEVCGQPVERVFRPVAVHFKGSGFYTTDYARKAQSDEKPKPESGKESKPEAKPSESKASSGEKGSDGKSKAASTKD